MTANRAPVFVQRALGGVVRTVDDLTPGQRWTASLMVGLALVVLAFGLPSPVRVVGGGGEAAAAASPGGVASAPEGAGGPEAAPAVDLPAGGDVGGLVLSAPDAGTTDGTGPASGDASTESV